MMKYLKIIICVLLFASASNLFAQNCGSVTFVSQSQVDNFVATNSATCTELDALVISSNFSNPGPLDLSGLTFITKIASLRVASNTTVTSFQGLNNVTDITQITIGGDVSSLDGLQGVTNLNKMLLLSGSTVSSFNGLNNLQTIESTFQIDGASLGPNMFQGLDNLTSIVYLDINRSNVSSFIGLENLTSISVLNLYETNITSFMGLGNVTSLNDFSIRDNSNPISFIGLGNVTSIGNLVLTSNIINSFAGFDSLTSMEFLWLLSGNTVTSGSFVGLESLTSLSKLNIYGGPSITSLQGLENLSSPQMTTLFLYNCNISSLDVLQNAMAPTMDFLDITYCNQLQNIDALSNVGRVVNWVEIENNDNLLNIDGLSNLKDPGQELSIKSNTLLNSIEGLSSIESFTNPDENDPSTTIYISGNPSLFACCVLVPFLNGFIPVEFVNIGGNAGNCSSRQVIFDLCNSIVDSDGDGTNDDVDLCPIISGNQSDIDNDGIGDACDDDIDGDGILDINDNCPNFANNNQADANGDGIGDSCNDQSGAGTGSFGVGTDMPVSKLQVAEGDVYVDNLNRGIIMRTADGRCFRYRPDKTGKLVGKRIICPN